MKPVHVIEGEVRHRAKVANTLSAVGIPIEIYENLGEFLDRAPANGVILASDDSGTVSCENILHSLQSHGTYLPVIMYSERPKPEQIVSAMLAGALDYLTWPIEPTVVESVFQKLDGAAALKVERERKSIAAVQKIEALSKREVQVLRQVAQGLSNKGIAQSLGISPRTVEIHRANALSKLNAQSTVDAVRIAIYAGLDD